MIIRILSDVATTFLMEFTQKIIEIKFHFFVSTESLDVSFAFWDWHCQIYSNLKEANFGMKITMMAKTDYTLKISTGFGNTILIWSRGWTEPSSVLARPAFSARARLVSLWLAM